MKKASLILLFSFFLNYILSQHLNMVELDYWKDTIATDYNDCWGWSQNGKEYAVIGSKFGAHIIDVTNPTNIFEVDRVKGRYTGNNVVHRDFKTHNGYLYMVGDQGNASLQIVNLSYLPDSVHLVYDEDSLLVRSHNIFIDTTNDRLYSAGGTKLSGDNHLRIIDISNPINPFLLKDCRDSISWWESTVGYVHDVHVKNNIVYTHDEDAMHIIDFNDVNNPIVLGALSSYPDKGYNHSGWLHSNDSTYVLLDETVGKRIKFLDVSTPNNIQVTDVEGVISGDNTNTIPHNAFVLGDMVYVSYYDDGVYVYDVSNPSDVKINALYDVKTGPNGFGSQGVWGVYPYLPSGNIIASDIGSGLHVIGYEEPTVQFVLSSDSTQEGTSKAIEIKLSHAISKEVQVQVIQDGASVADMSDYTLNTSTVIFPSNFSANQTIQVQTIVDANLEGFEPLLLDLNAPINASLGFNDTFTLFISDEAIAGLYENRKSAFRLYPNPVNRGEVLSFSEVTTYAILDVTGKTIESGIGNSISTSTLSPGVYFVQTKFGSIKWMVN